MSTMSAVVHRPTKEFTFDNITISTTGKKVGGWYFAKIAHDNRPLYVEVPEVLTKAGFVKVSNQTVCDLMLSPSEDEEVITWIEELVSRCHILLSDHANDWFSQPFSVADIDSVFDSPMKSYKSGRFQLCRCSITTSGEHPTVVYDESQKRMVMDDISVGSDTRVVPIIEVCGISFTTTRFRLSLKIKQMMIVTEIDPEEFNTCMIQRTGRKGMDKDAVESGKIPMDIRAGEVSKTHTVEMDEDVDSKRDIKQPAPPETLEDEPQPEETLEDEPHPEETLEDEPHPEETLEDESQPDTLTDTIDEPDVKEESDLNTTPISTDSESETTTWDTLVSAGEIISITPEVNTDASTIDLKDPIQVYQQRYARAKKRAQQLKNDAIRAILEANSIKDAYSILNYEDSESDVSDIELEIE